MKGNIQKKWVKGNNKQTEANKCSKLMEPKISNLDFFNSINLLIINFISISSSFFLQTCIMRRSFSLLPVIVERIDVLNHFDTEKLFSEIEFVAGEMKLL